jgi:hypothetical protein
MQEESALLASQVKHSAQITLHVDGIRADRIGADRKTTVG